MKDPNDHITYNRSQRHYEVLDPDTGEMVTFPSGCKHDALQHAIAMLSPDLFALAQKVIDKFPQLASRVWKASSLVLSGKVRLVSGSNVMAMVSGSDEYGDYLIRSRDGFMICDCPDFGNSGVIIVNSEGIPVSHCKHTICIQMIRRLEVINVH